VFPVAFELDDTAHEVTSANPCGTPVSLSLRGGEVYDQAPDEPELRPGREGEPGDKYVAITYRALGISGECGGANVQDPILRLEIDGLPAIGANFTNIALKNGEGQDFVVVYVVPADASEFRVLLGDPDGEIAEVDIDIPTFGG
jgi:hypothetical protein